MPIPSTQEIRNYLENYGLDTTATYALTGDVAIGSAVVNNINTTNLKPSMLVSGASITPATRILSVNVISSTVGQITLDSTATGTHTAQALTITYYTVISDDWIVKKRDNDIIPWIEKVCRTSFSAPAQIEEYYSGNGTSIIILNRKPIISLDALSYTNVMSNQYVINLFAIQVISEEGILKVRTNFNESTWIPIFAKGMLNLRIKYTYGYATTPVDIAEAIKCLVCERVLALVGARTGGGSLGVQAFNRNYGDLGKYTDIRRELSRDAQKTLANYFTRTVGA
jgi:hypothetical protein